VFIIATVSTRRPLNRVGNLSARSVCVLRFVCVFVERKKKKKKKKKVAGNDDYDYGIKQAGDDDY